MIKLNWRKNKKGKRKISGSSPPKIKLEKGTKFVSFLFIATSMLVAALIVKASNMYYDLDSSKIIVNEVQRVVQTGGVALEILGTSVFGDGGTTNYAQFSETGDLSFLGAADTITGPGAGGFTMTNASGPLTLSTTTAGAFTITSAGTLAINSLAGTWDATTLSLDGTDDSNLTVTGSSKKLTLAAAGGGANQVIINSAGTSASAVDINATGTVAGNAITMDTTDGGIALTAGGSANGDITLTAGDDMTLTGAAGSVLTVGNTGAVAQTINVGTGTAVDTINIGTGATGADVIRIGQAAADVALTDANWSIGNTGLITTSNDVAINGGDLTTTATTFNLLNTNATTINFGGVATAINFGAAAGTTMLSAGDLTMQSTGALAVKFDDASGFILQDDVATPINYMQIATDGTLTFRTGASGDEIDLNPAGASAGIVRVATGDELYVGDVPIAATNEATLVGVIPIFGFDLPARTASTSYIAISRVIEDFPNFPTLTTGKVRQYKFIIRYADTLNPADGTTAYRVSNWEVWNVTGGAQTATFDVPASPSTTDAGLEKGNSYITGSVTIPTNTDDWQLRAKLPTTSKSLQIYQVFLAAYDVVD